MLKILNLSQYKCFIYLSGNETEGKSFQVYLFIFLIFGFLCFVLVWYEKSYLCDAWRQDGGQIFLIFPAGWFSPYFLPFPAINHKFSAADFLPDATVYSWLYEKRSEPWRKEDVTESPGTESIFVLYICCGHKKTATVLDSARLVIVKTHTMHTKRGPALKQADALNELHRTLLSYAAPYSGQRHILSELRRTRTLLSYAAPYLVASWAPPQPPELLPTEMSFKNLWSQLDKH